MTKLKPCPFCGGEAKFERRGTKRQSCIIACTECGCRHEGPEEYEQCGYQWNMRVTDQAHAAKTKAEWQAEDVESLLAFRSAVTGWRENDWPEWFCRRTAEAVADRGRQAEGGE